MLISRARVLAHADARGSSGKQGGGLMRVLLVDDDVHIRKLLRTALRLEAEDLELREAENGHDAVRLARDFHPDVIILDYWMPEMDGESTARSIRALDPKARIISFSGVLEKKPDWADAHYVKGQLPDLERIIRLPD
jgi:CheY-like chemotaxis protein